MTQIEEQLENAISEGFDGLKSLTPGSEEYTNAVKAIIQMFEADSARSKIAFEEYEREDRIALEKRKVELEEQKAKDDSKWHQKFEPYIITGFKIGGSVLMILGVMSYESGGHIFKLGDVAKCLPKIG